MLWNLFCLIYVRDLAFLKLGREERIVLDCGIIRPVCARDESIVSVCLEFKSAYSS